MSDEETGYSYLILGDYSVVLAEYSLQPKVLNEKALQS